MNITKLIIVALFGTAIMLSVPHSAEADWGIPNPFSWGSKKPAKKNEPSTLSKINTSTKNFFVKTGDFLNPFSESKKKYYPKMPKMSMPKMPSFASDDKPAAQKEESSGWGGWFSEEEEKPAPRTVSEFMDLDRARF